ncbi:GNAT family N-acetyltransferase [Kitasatospora purpeofusca]|uniref:GNAT family N-acetyltransferase n=1 Tax=Kitasatospora purpeofusca TaxID=67352 RepID=UPI002251D307|nr:GNAT family N-acetyltransferase [Kitasatospora purpeofusca]MCX4690135.1 GNAT family N-acetyltransferase [Kitasatospora purpeofusca]
MRGDAPRVAALLAACEAADRTGDRRGTPELLDDWAAPGIDLAEGSLCAWAGPEPVAYAVTRAREHADPVHEMVLDLAVHPAHRMRDVLARLLAECRRLAARRHRERFGDGTPLELHTRTHGHQRWLAEALDAAGYRRARGYRGMRIDLTAHAQAHAQTHVPAAAPVLPPGSALVPFEDRHDEALLTARNAIFAGHPGSVPMTPETWRHAVTGNPYFRPGCSFLLLSADGRRVLCYLLTTEYPTTEYPTTGAAAAGGGRELYLANAGTSPELHGRGLYRAVITHTLAHAKRLGYHRAVLDVDDTNTMAVGGFYERLGARTFRTWTGHVLSVPTGPTRVAQPPNGAGAAGDGSPTA